MMLFQRLIFFALAVLVIIVIIATQELGWW